jgi:TonB-dependent SusC/RagA subfamily outer membrane receptor
MKGPLMIIFSILLICIIKPHVYAQSDNYSSETIVAKLKNYNSTHTLENAYLQLDKPYYATGDTIYFKAYVTSGERHQLSDLSAVLHVDLIGMDNKIEQGIKLPLVNGLAWGDLALPDTLPPGNYRIRAYTRWMLNEGNLFDAVVPLGSVHTQRVPESSTAKAILPSPDLQFFPESGQLIAGLPVRVAFKAIGMNGLGIGVKGSVTDNTGKLVCRLESAHLGMGSFSFVLENGKSYQAHVLFADGSRNDTSLPAVLGSGITLTVNNDSLPQATVKILCNAPYFDLHKGKEYTLLIYSGGSATTVPIRLDSAAVSLAVLKRHLQTGIATITLFSDTNEPLCERLFFVQNYDQLSLNLAADKSSYATREKVSIRLHAKTRADSAALGHFSVSVTDESKVEVNQDKENTILSNLLLTADLKGTVEQPNYYFNNITKEKLAELDLVMLTHGYRRFEWKQVLDNNDQPLAFQPEKGLEITGKAESLLGASLAKARVSLLPTRSKQIFTTTADDQGNFTFHDLAFWDSTSFVLQATSAKGKKYTKLVYHSGSPVPVSPMAQPTNENVNTLIAPAYLANNEKQQEELNKLGLGKGRMIKEVKIKGIRPDDQYETQSLAGAGHADQVLHRKDIGYGSSLVLALDGKLHGVGFAGGVPFLRGIGDGPMLVIVDGAEMQGDRTFASKDKNGNAIPSQQMGFDVNGLNLSDIETVEVLKYASASIYGMSGGNGVLIITTRKGGSTKPEDIASTGILPITVQGYEKVREFYSPKYESGITYNHPDLRSTIYWKPELTTDKDGNASFDFYNADGTGTYRVVVEGIDEKGNIGRQTFTYKVQ